MEHHTLERPRIATSRRNPSIVRLQFENVDVFQTTYENDGAQGNQHSTVGRELSREKVVPQRESMKENKRSISIASLGKRPSRLSRETNFVELPESENCGVEDVMMKQAPEPPKVPSRPNLVISSGAIKAKKESTPAKTRSIAKSASSSNNSKQKPTHAIPKWAAILGYPTTSEALAQELAWLMTNAARQGVPSAEVQLLLDQFEPLELLQQKLQPKKEQKITGTSGRTMLGAMRSVSSRLSSVKDKSLMLS